MEQNTQQLPEAPAEAPADTQRVPEVDLSKLSHAELSALLSNARKQADALKDAARNSAQEAVASVTQAVLKVQPVAPAGEKGWVGTSLGGFEVEIDGVKFSVQVTIKDVEATKKAQAALKAA